MLEPGHQGFRVLEYDNKELVRPLESATGQGLDASLANEYLVENGRDEVSGGPASIDLAGHWLGKNHRPIERHRSRQRAASGGERDWVPS